MQRKLSLSDFTSSNIRVDVSRRLSGESVASEHSEMPKAEVHRTKEVERKDDMTEVDQTFSVKSDPIEIKKLCIQLIPRWNELKADDITVRQIMAGLTNQLFQVCRRDGVDEKFLFRIYGEDVGDLYNPDEELESFKYLAKLGLAPGLVATFDGGRIEKWILGPALLSKEMTNPSVMCTVATMLARLHSLPTKREDFPKFPVRPLGHFFSWRQACHDLIQTAMADPQADPVLKRRLEETRALEVFELTKEDTLQSVLIPADAAPSILHDIGFCHNDLQENNMLVENGRLQFIDFEYSGLSLRAADVSNFFAEATLDYCVDEYPFYKYDESLYPTVEMQKIFASVYLSEALGETVWPSNDKFQKPFLDAVARFSMFGDALWGFWSVIRCPDGPFTKDTFDFLLYARDRFTSFIAKYQKYSNM